MTADTSLLADSEPPPSPTPEPSSAAGRSSARNAVLAIAVLITIAVAAALFIGRGPSSSSDGARATSFRSAAPFTLPELRGDRPDVVLTARPPKPTVVNFFAAWCAPCKRELPAFRAAAAANPNVTFIGVDHQDSREDAIELLDQFGITYPAGYDPQGEVAARYGVRGLPATAFIDTDGRIIEFRQGELSAKELNKFLERLTLKKAPA